MDSENHKEKLYTDILQCVLDVFEKLNYFVDTATEEELLKWSDLVDVRSRLYCTIARGTEMGPKQREKKTMPV